MNSLDRPSTPTDCFWPTPVSLDADRIAPGAFEPPEAVPAADSIPLRRSRRELVLALLRLVHRFAVRSPSAITLVQAGLMAAFAAASCLSWLARVFLGGSR